MLDFYADWCVSCKELERYTFSDSVVQATLADVVLLRTDVTADDARDQALLKALGLFGPPAILFFGPDGRERPEYRVVGYVEADFFEAHVRKAVSSGGRTVAKTAVGL
jgi:thiol:disulfide interchange protein DsbD